MKQEVRKALFADYSAKVGKKGHVENVIKYPFSFKGVKVRVYFDAFDKNNPQLTVSLFNDREIYCTLVSVVNTSEQGRGRYGWFEGFHKTPSIKRAVRDMREGNATLQSLFDAIDQHILEGKYELANYDTDDEFKRAAIVMEREGKKLFISHLAHLPAGKEMSSKMRKKLELELGIDKKVIKQIADKGFTVYRTVKASQRKKLEVVLEKAGLSGILHG